MRLLIYLLPGLLLGMASCRSGLASSPDVRRMLAGRRTKSLRCVLAVFGFGMLMTALLSWLAVIDVDKTVILHHRKHADHCTLEYFDRDNELYCVTAAICANLINTVEKPVIKAVNI